MADRIRKVDYWALKCPDKPGAGAEMLAIFKKERVSFAAVHAFPEGKSVQVDLVPKDARKFLRVAKKAKLRLRKKKKAFLLEAGDRAGCLAGVLADIAGAGVNVSAITGLAAGGGRCGAIFWVKPRDYNRAARALGAK